MPDPSIHDPSEVYLFLHEGPEIAREPLTETFWPTIHERTDLQRGRLITAMATDGDWSVWEMHPAAEEVILVTEGASRFHLDDGDEVTEHVVTAPEYLVVPTGTWHTMDVIEPGRAVVITWGEGTQHRPR